MTSDGLLALLALKQMPRLALEGCLGVGDTFRSPSSSIVSLLFSHLRAGDMDGLSALLALKRLAHLNLEGCRASVKTKYFNINRFINVLFICQVTSDGLSALLALEQLARLNPGGLPRPWRHLKSFSNIIFSTTACAFAAGDIGRSVGAAGAEAAGAPQPGGLPWRWRRGRRAPRGAAGHCGPGPGRLRRGVRPGELVTPFILSICTSLIGL